MIPELGNVIEQGILLGPTRIWYVENLLICNWWSHMHLNHETRTTLWMIDETMAFQILADNKWLIAELYYLLK